MNKDSKKILIKTKKRSATKKPKQQKTQVKSNKNTKLKFPKLKIDNFCEENNKLFKKIYLFLNSPKNIIILMNSLKILTHPKVQKAIVKEIKNNKESIYQILEDFNTIMDFYKSNNLILKSEVGHFILYYEYNLKKIKIKNDKDYLIFFNKIINYPKLISLLKEIFYILSDFRLCIYFMTPNIKFRNTSKDNVHEFVKKFNTNHNMLYSIVSGFYPGDNSPWGKYYTSCYACFESLTILKKYYKDPLKAMKIDFKYKKKNNNKQIIKKLSDIYNIKLNKIEKIFNVTNYIILMKKMKYDMHEVVCSIFNAIYQDHVLKNIKNSYIIDNVKIFKQKNHYKLGTKIFILVNDGYISNVNCFENFVI